MSDKGLAVLLYLFAGWLTMALATVMGDILIPKDEFAHAEDIGPIIAVVLFWPLFAIKYLAIGVWYILTSGYTALV